MPHASSPPQPPEFAEALDISLADDALSRLYTAFGQYGDVFRVYSPVTQTHIYVFNHPDHVSMENTERNLAFAYKFRALSKLIMSRVNRRRAQNEERFDLLAMPIGARERKSGEPMSDRQLLDEIMTLIVTGHETTASALNWMWYLLLQHPAVEQRLHHEIDNLPGPPAPIESTAGLPNTRQVIQEILRLYPPGWLLTRRSISADNIDGYPIAPKTDVLISPYIAYRYPAFWVDLERFDPDRFDAEHSATDSATYHMRWGRAPASANISRWS